jgi:hypothetical protein
MEKGEPKAPPFKFMNNFLSDAQEALSKIEHIDSAYYYGEEDDRRIIVWTREHDMVSRDELIKVEDLLSERYGYVDIVVRAHQDQTGRCPECDTHGMLDAPCENLSCDAPKVARRIR